MEREQRSWLHDDPQRNAIASNAISITIANISIRPAYVKDAEVSPSFQVYNSQWSSSSTSQTLLFTFYGVSLGCDEVSYQTSFAL